MKISRRNFLKQSRVVAPVIIYPGFLGDTPCKPISAYLGLPISRHFLLGVSSGDVTQERAIVWTRTFSKMPIKLVVWERHNAQNSLPNVSTNVIASEPGFVHVDVTQLKPDTQYQFTFIETDYFSGLIARSRVGSFRTAPVQSSNRSITIGAVSCTHNDYNPVVLEHAGARSDIDVFLLLGDTSYNDGCTTLSDFRRSWASNLGKKGYLDLKSSTSVIATLDDHEITDNFNPETVPYAVRDAAIKAFFENTPIRVNPTKWSRIWRSFRWGPVEIFVLDCRLERRPSTRNTFRETYISKEQMEWLKTGLKSSRAPFKVIMNSVPIGTFPFFYESDRWEGYPMQREEILRFIDEEEITGLLWLAGDFHFASVGRVSYEGPGSRQIEILAGPGAQIPNYLAAALNWSPQFDWSSVKNNYVTLTFDPQKYELKIIYFGGLENPNEVYDLYDVREIYRQTISFDSPCSFRCEGVSK